MAALLTAAVALLVTAARWGGWLERLELLAFDAALRQAPSVGEAADRVVFVAVTEEDIQRLETYPIPDAVLAEVIGRLVAAGVRAVGIDIYRDLPVPPGHEDLVEVVTANPTVVFPVKQADATTEGVAGPPWLAGTQQVAANNMVLDADGVSRRGLLFWADAEGISQPTFSLLLALVHLSWDQLYLGPHPEVEEWVSIGPTPLTPLAPTAGGYAGVDAAGYQLLIECPPGGRALPRTTLHEVLEGRTDAALLEGRTALLGVMADSLRDDFHVACGRHPIAGAELHGRITEQLLAYAYGEGRPLASVPDWAELGSIWLLAVVGALLGVHVRSPLRFALLGAGALVALWGTALVGLGQGAWLPVVPAGLALAGSTGGVTAFLRNRERSERAELMQLFSRHVDRRIAEEVWKRRDEFLEGGRPRPERLTATVLFLDMKGYTARAEKMEPDELVVWLDSYLQAFSQRIMQAGGYVVDYFGDGIMACFGVPIPRDAEGARQEAGNAVRCALSLEEAVVALNSRWAREVDLPPIGLRVGIATGEVVAGSMGSSERIKYALVGDVVNTAQRIESVDASDHDFRAQPCRILIGARTREMVGEDFDIQAAGDFKLKGKAAPVTLYRVFGPGGAGTQASRDDLEATQGRGGRGS